MRGRRADPPAVQAAKGNPGKRRRRTVADIGIEIAELDAGAPAHLSEDARRIWLRTAPELQRINIAKKSDRNALERYCETLADWWRTELKYRGRAKVYWTESQHGKMKRIEPELILHHRNAQLLIQYEDRLGLSPMARQSILRGLAAQASLPLEPATAAGESTAPAAGDPAASASPIGFLNQVRTDRPN